MVLNLVYRFFLKKTLPKLASHPANQNSIIKHGVTKLVFELLAVEANIKCVFSRYCCCYSNPRFAKIKTFISEWADFFLA